MTSSQEIRAALARNLKAVKPDVPEHTSHTPTVQVYRQWIADCRAVADVLELFGEAEREFLRECGVQS